MDPAKTELLRVLKDESLPVETRDAAQRELDRRACELIGQAEANVRKGGRPRGNWRRPWWRGGK